MMSLPPFKRAGKFEPNKPERSTDIYVNSFPPSDDEISAMRMLAISAVVGVLWMVAAVLYWTMG